MDDALQTRTALVIVTSCALATLLFSLQNCNHGAPAAPRDWRLRDANGQIVTHVYGMQDPCDNPDWEADLDHAVPDPNNEPSTR